MNINLKKIWPYAILILVLAYVINNYYKSMNDLSLSQSTLKTLEQDYLALVEDHKLTQELFDQQVSVSETTQTINLAKIDKLEGHIEDLRDRLIEANNLYGQAMNQMMALKDDNLALTHLITTLEDDMELLEEELDFYTSNSRITLTYINQSISFINDLKLEDVASLKKHFGGHFDFIEEADHTYASNLLSGSHFDLYSHRVKLSSARLVDYHYLADQDLLLIHYEAAYIHKDDPDYNLGLRNIYIHYKITEDSGKIIFDIYTSP